MVRINRTPRYLINTTKGKDMKKGFTLIVTFSRKWCVHNFFAHFNKLEIDLDNCHFILFDNSNNALLTDALLKKAEVYKDAFYTFRLYKSFRSGGSLRTLQRKGSYKLSKLPKIYRLHRDFLKMITTEEFVLLEDDTLIPPHAIVRLLELLRADKKVGMVTGIETGRSMFKHHPTRLGVHYLTKKNGFILERISPKPQKRGILEVDACGWYCCASYRKLWTLGFKGMSKYLYKIPRFALDNYQTSNIKDAGYKILADFGIQCIHMNVAGPRIVFWTQKDAIPMVDVWIPKWKMYGQGIWLEHGETNKYLKWYHKPKMK